MTSPLATKISETKATIDLFPHRLDFELMGPHFRWLESHFTNQRAREDKIRCLWPDTS